MELEALMLFFHIFVEIQRERDEHHRRAASRRRRRLYCVALCQRGGRFQRQRSRRHYCGLNPTVPVLRRFFAGEDTRPDFGVSRAAITALLRALGTERQHGWGPTLETLVFLFWLAGGSAYRIVSAVFEMPLPTVFRAVRRMADEVLGVLPRFISLPSTKEELQAVGDGFATLAGHPAFARSAGAIDGTHIRVRCPGGPDGQDYINRKLFPSVVLQAVCDHQSRFLDIFVGLPGSVRDAGVLENSPIYLQGTYPPPGYFLLGDGGYPCLENPLALITPYRQPVTGAVERQFNAHHSRARSVTAHAFGAMKTRFRSIFLEAPEVHVQFVPKVVACCAIMHNICLDVGDKLQEEPPAEEEEGQGAADAPGGAEMRRLLAAQVSVQQEAVHGENHSAV